MSELTSSESLQQRLTLARSLAVDAAKQTLHWFKGPVPYATPKAAHSPGLTSRDIVSKSDGSPVTIADRHAEQFLREQIAAQFPEDSVLGEEFGEKSGSSNFRWILDPIDGTVSFVHGVPLFGTLIGIEHNNTPVAGVIALPALDEVLSGGPAFGAWHELGTFSGNQRPLKPARVSTTKSLKDATAVITSLDYCVKANRADIYANVQSACAVTRGWSDCYAFVLAATGRIDAVVEPLVKPWDVAAIQPILEAAGGKCTDFQGERSIHTGNCVVSNGHIHDELLRIIAQHR